MCLPGSGKTTIRLWAFHVVATRAAGANVSRGGIADDVEAEQGPNASCVERPFDDRKCRPKRRLYIQIRGI
jgi:hypothetical protein